MSERWKAIAEYRTDNGVVDVEWLFEEVDDLHDFIERGPDWNSLVKVTLNLNRRSEKESYTVEEAMGQ